MYQVYANILYTLYQVCAKSPFGIMSVQIKIKYINSVKLNSFKKAEIIQILYQVDANGQ